jgi:hypothetical protein
VRALEAYAKPQTKQGRKLRHGRTKNCNSHHGRTSKSHRPIFHRIFPPLFAALLGAHSAFRLENHRRKSDERKKQIKAGDYAIFVLGRYLNELVVYQRQTIDPTRDYLARIVAMMPTQEILSENLAIDVAELHFLVDAGCPTLLYELLVQESHFRHIVAAINERSELHRGPVQKAIEAAGIKEGEDFTLDYLRNVLGDQIFLTLERSTDEIIKSTDKAVKTLAQESEELRSALKVIFPKAKFIQFSVDDDAVQQQNAANN